MNWEVIGVVAELIGALAVVMTVAYLAVQIRNENRRAIREDRRARTERISNAYMELADTDHLADVLLKVSNLSGSKTGWRNVAEATGLEHIDAIRYSFSRQGMLHGFQHTFTDKNITEEERESTRMRLRYTVEQDGTAFSSLWEVLGPTFLPEFRAAVQSELDRADKHKE